MTRLLYWIFGENVGLRSVDGYAAPMSVENRTSIIRFGVLQGVAVSTIAFVGVLGLVLTGASPPGVHAGRILAVLALGVVVWAPLLVLAVRRFPITSFPLFGVGTTALMTTLAFTMGPSLSILMGLGYVMLGTTIFVSYQRRAALIYAAIIAVGYASVVIWQSGNTAPFTRWIVVVGAVVVVGVTVSSLVDRVRDLAQAERRASGEAQRARAAADDARAETEELNRTLENRVEAQVAEIESLNRLRRFLSPQVAEAVLSEGDEALLQPHRRQIAVFFCDLRGFTSFTGGAEPEEVVEALDEYYRVVGDVLRRYDATVGTFAGDGIMAYLNDPVPCKDAAGTAVQMALELREPMAAFIDTWHRRGYDLGYGVGIAYGYATLGTIGFEGRNDYTALGSVVNLAARLCGEAGSGQVLIDGRASEALDQRFEVNGRSVMLKGFASPVPAFEVVR